METEQPDDMLTTLNADVDFALTEYNDSKVVEQKAYDEWVKRKIFETDRPTAPTAAEKVFLKKSVKQYYRRYTKRMKHRIKKKETFDKRMAAKDKHKSDTDVIERRENWVYKDGPIYNIRWSSLPQ